jgi:hypothetical protein
MLYNSIVPSLESFLPESSSRFLFGFAIKQREANGKGLGATDFRLKKRVSDGLWGEKRLVVGDRFS